MENESLQKQAQQTIEEARMVLPGIQALFGFQLIAIFNARFEELTLHEQYLHFSALLLVALAIALIMAPAPIIVSWSAERCPTSLLIWHLASSPVPWSP